MAIQRRRRRFLKAVLNVHYPSKFVRLKFHEVRILSLWRRVGGDKKHFFNFYLLKAPNQEVSFLDYLPEMQNNRVMSYASSAIGFWAMAVCSGVRPVKSTVFKNQQVIKTRWSDHNAASLSANKALSG